MQTNVNEHHGVEMKNADKTGVFSADTRNRVRDKGLANRHFFIRNDGVTGSSPVCGTSQSSELPTATDRIDGSTRLIGLYRCPLSGSMASTIRK
jgi:hypothetical protein